MTAGLIELGYIESMSSMETGRDKGPAFAWRERS